MTPTENLFRRESLDQLSQQDKIGPYVNTARMMPWLTLVAVLILLLSFLVWSFAGTLPISVSCRGICPDYGPTCYLFVSPQQMQKYKIEVGDSVRVTRPNGEALQGKITEVSNTPMSQAELSENINDDWLLEEVSASEYNYYLYAEVNGSLEAADLLDAVITVDNVQPIMLLVNP